MYLNQSKTLLKTSKSFPSNFLLFISYNNNVVFMRFASFIKKWNCSLFSFSWNIASSKKYWLVSTSLSKITCSSKDLISYNHSERTVLFFKLTVNPYAKHLLPIVNSYSKKVGLSALELLPLQYLSWKATLSMVSKTIFLPAPIAFTKFVFPDALAPYIEENFNTFRSL